jgi:hypothetical protein
MFHDWDGFYLIVGSAGGALIGIMFLIVTLTAGFDKALVERGSRVYMTPIVFHFSAILVISALTAVPGLDAHQLGVAFAILALIGFGYSVETTVRMHAPDWSMPPDLSDKWFYGYLPSFTYVAIGVGAAEIWIDKASAPYLIGGAMLAQLLVGIRNTWDLATYMIQNPTGRGESGTGTDAGTPPGR